MAPICCGFDQTAVWHSDAARGPSTPSFDYLVGDGEERGRNRQAECPRGLEIDNEREPRWLLDWKFGGGGSFQNTIDIGRRLAVLRNTIDPVRHQAAIPGKNGKFINCRQSVASR